MPNRNILLLFFFFVFFLMALFVFYQTMAIGTLQTALQQYDQARLASLGEAVRDQLNTDRQEDPYELHQIAKAVGAKQILVIKRDGTILADSTRAVNAGEKILPSFHKAFEGSASYRIFHDASQRFGEILLPLTPQGPLLRITMLLPAAENPGAEGLLLLIKLAGWIGGGVFSYSVLRLFIKRLRATEALTHRREPDDEGSAPWVTTVQGIVHQMKQKEIELTQMNENILQSVTSGVISFNRAGKVITVNPAAQAILGLSREAMLGADCTALFGADSPIPARLAETLEQGKEVLREECELVSQKWLGFTASALRDGRGTVIGTLLVFADLTEIKALHAEVELKKRFEMMGEIAAWIAHEFRNDMGTIMGYAKLLSKDLTPNTPQHDMAKAIAQECITMEQVITDLLAYGKKPSLTLVRTDMVPLIEEILEPFKSQAPSVKFVTMGTSSAASEAREGCDPCETCEVCEAAIDPILMRQVISNLIQNGIQAMNGSGTLTFQFNGNKEGGCEIKISDSGRGIPKNHLDKIFLPFFTTREKGSGLGLAFARKIVLAHQGTLSVESQEGKGTTFTMTLPKPPTGGSEATEHVVFGNTTDGGTGVAGATV